MNWVGGVEVPEAALSLLGQGGIPSVGLVQGGQIVAVKLEHVWVESWLDFVPSRGAVHREGDTWVPLDASFKQYTYTSGMDLSRQVPFDTESFLTQLTATAQTNEAEAWISGLDHDLLTQLLAAYQTQLTTFVTMQNPEATVGDVIGTKTIVPSQRTVLAAGLPYPLVVRGTTWQQIPAPLRHQFQFTLYASEQDRTFDVPVFRVTQSLPQLTGRKLTLSFVPASEADATLLASFLPTPPVDGQPLDLSAFPTSLPGYLIHLKAEWRVGGEVVATGGPFMMGQTLVSTQGLYEPQIGWETVENLVVTGEYQAFAIDAAGIAANQVHILQEQLKTTKEHIEKQEFSGFTLENSLGDLLYNAVLSYLAINDVIDRLRTNVPDIITYRRPSFGRFTLVAQPQYWFGLPQSVAFPGLEMDIDHLISMIASRSNSREAQVAYTIQSGLRQSALEHAIPELLFAIPNQPGEAVSAVKALALASQQGQRLYTITSDNINISLPKLAIQAEDKLAVQDAVMSGKVAVVSQQSITVGGWTGIGYILLDPETGSGGYYISGGANGGGMIIGFLTAFLLMGFATAGPVGFVAVLFLEIVAFLGFLMARGILSAVFGEEAYDPFKLFEVVLSDMPCFWQGVLLGFLIAALPFSSIRDLGPKYGWPIIIFNGFGLLRLRTEPLVSCFF
jgi:hypothetical protein